MSEMVTLNHDGVLHVGEMAVLFQFPGRKTWLPLAHMGCWDSDTVELERWLVEKECLDEFADD